MIYIDGKCRADNKMNEKPDGRNEGIIIFILTYIDVG